MDQKLLGPTAAAFRLGIGPQQVAKLAKQGRLPYVQTSVGRLYTPEAVEQLARERAARAARLAATK